MINKVKNSIKDLVNSSIKKELDELTILSKENYWANVFNSSIQGISWIQNIPLNVGRWAANYSLLYILFRILNEVKPSATLELGLGESTKIFQAYKKYHNNNAYCLTIEHDFNWISLKRENGISSDYIDIKQVEIVESIVNGYNSIIYKDLTNSLKSINEKFDLILIDGPLGSDNYSRYNIIDIVKNELINDDFIIIIDDFNRNGERETLQDLKLVLKKADIQFSTGVYKGDKEQIVICSNKYKYLTTL